jgi:hypothetical protein
MKLLVPTYEYDSKVSCITLAVPKDRKNSNKQKGQEFPVRKLGRVPTVLSSVLAVRKLSAFKCGLPC